MIYADIGKSPITVLLRIGGIYIAVIISNDYLEVLVCYMLGGALGWGWGCMAWGVIGAWGLEVTMNEQ